MARAADGPLGQSAWQLYFRFGARRTVRGRGGDRRAGLAGEAAGGARLAVVRGAVAAGGPCHAIRRRGAAAAVSPPRHELRLGGADGMGEPRFSALSAARNLADGRAGRRVQPAMAAAGNAPGDAAAAVAHGLAASAPCRDPRPHRALVAGASFGASAAGPAWRQPSVAMEI